ncbi:hypothetical protein FB451DRAFT_1232194 [Mycena latifolia]|nr:hypothetical protein FB451DRAFT_1232194 [Mycena latifolia]
MKKYLSFPLLSAVALAASQSIDSEGQPCKVHAWVRAQDLSPDHISHGELRIKVPRAECAQQIAAVALRLQLDEFGEVKFLKQGAELPAIQTAANQTAPMGYEDWTGSSVMYDYQARDDAMSDPELWTVVAEERRAWATEATLLDNNPNCSQPIITPFTVAVPAVNYPPSVTRYRSLQSPISRHSFNDLGYHYIAVVTFTDGHTAEVPAGYTTFVPMVHASAARKPFTWNTTFEQNQCGVDSNSSPQEKKRVEDLERCLPEAQRSSFFAEITLEEGNVVKRGLPVKGRVTVHSTSGSTTMSDISVNLRTVLREHWAQAQAAGGGDAGFHNATSPMCKYWGSDQKLDPESDNYMYIFGDDNDRMAHRMFSHYPSSYGVITPAHPYFDFELEIPEGRPVDFATYYAHSETLVQLALTVIYSEEAATCANPSARPPKEEVALAADDATMTEEGLWDSYTRVGQKVRVQTYHRSLTLQATVPITIVDRAAPADTLPIAHYLTPGLPAPVLRRGAQVDVPAFPSARPLVVAEALVNTSARLMQAGSSDPYYTMQQFMNASRFALNSMYPDPTKDYRSGNYAGLLWRKKVVAEERGIWPVRSEQVVEEGNHDEQHHFAT